jgi:hypothetical protein
MPTDKLADAELVFEEGLLSGMKLVGFTIWRNRHRAVCSVTFPARQYMVNGERRSYALLRSVEVGGSGAAQETLRLLILQAYAEYERQASVTYGGALLEAPDVEASGASAEAAGPGSVDDG